jgi:hypothetical protein
MTRREYKGAAQAAVLTAVLGGSTADVQLICSDLTNWPSGIGSRPFFIVVDRGTASEEKILCSSRTGNVLTVFDNGVTNGRAADGTAITSHSINAVVEHVFTATDADEANAHINGTTNVHGIPDTTLLATKTYADGAASTAVEAHRTDTTDVHGIPDTTLLATKGYADAAAAPKVSEVLTINAQVGTTYTLAATDAVSKFVTFNNASAITVTVPKDVFSQGNRIEFAALGAGKVTFSPASGVTIVPSTTLKLRAQYSGGALICLAANSFLLVGDISA